MFSVCKLEKLVRVYNLEKELIFPYSPSVFTYISFNNEYTVYKYKDNDDKFFESISKRFDPRFYHIFSIHEDCPGLDHIGIIHFLSGLFSEAKIPILYINTYSSNLILISEEYVENALKIMIINPNILIDIESISQNIQ